MSAVERSGRRPSWTALRRRLSSWREAWRLYRCVEQLDSFNEQDRLEACEQVTRLKGKGADRALVGCLVDDSDAVRAMATDELRRRNEGELAERVLQAAAGDEEAVRQLWSMTEREDSLLTPRFARRIQRLSETARKPGASPAPSDRSPVPPKIAPARDGIARQLRLLTQHPKQELREAARALMDQISDGVLSARALAPLLERDDPEVRQAACHLLGAANDRGAAPLLTGALTDREAMVRLAACRGLARLRAPEAVPALIERLAWVTPPSRELVHESLPVEPDPEVRAALCLALGRSEDDRAVPVLTDSVTDPDASVRKAAQQALDSLGDAAARSFLASLSHWSPRIREQACRGLTRMKSRRPVDAMIRLLGDPEPSVRAAAGDALRAWGRGRLAGVVERLLAGDAAALSDLKDLVRHGEVRVVEPLGLYAPRTEGTIRALVYRALADVGPQATGGLRERLHSHNTVTREITCRVLEEIAHALRPEVHSLLCRTCFVRFHETTDAVGELAAPVIACRACGASAHPLREIRSVVALLDSDADPVTVADGVVLVNALHHLAPFDFDRVEIRRATEEEVERFCIQTGNDADPLRRRRHHSVRCVVAPEAMLSPAASRMLEQMFGELESPGS